MSFKINFNRALIISFFWHLFWFFAITIIIAPAGIRQGGFSNISFLGSILDTDSFQEEFRPAARTYGDDMNLATGGLFLVNKVNTSVERPGHSYAEDDYLWREKPYKGSIGEILEAEKEPPFIHSRPEGHTLQGADEHSRLSIPSREPRTSARTGSITNREPPLKIREKDDEIEGEIKDRVILFRPPPPDCRGLISSQQQAIVGSYYKIKLRVMVTPDGSVKSVEKLQSCGSPDIDLVAMRYIEKWSFAPLHPGKPQDDQQGVILLKFRAE